MAYRRKSQEWAWKAISLPEGQQRGIEFLEDLLAEAKAGKVQSMVVVTTSSNSPVGIDFVNATASDVTQLSRRLLRLVVGILQSDPLPVAENN